MSGLWTASKMIMVMPLTHDPCGNQVEGICYLLELVGEITNGQINGDDLINIPNEEFFWDRGNGKFKEDTNLTITISNDKHSVSTKHVIFKGTKVQIKRLVGEEETVYLKDD